MCDYILLYRKLDLNFVECILHYLQINLYIFTFFCYFFYSLALQTLLILISVLLQVHMYPYCKYLDNVLELLTLSQSLLSFQIEVLLEALNFKGSLTTSASGVFIFQLFDSNSITVFIDFFTIIGLFSSAFVF